MNDVPPPPQPPPGPGGPAPGSGANLDIGAAVNFGWTGFTNNFAPWLLAMLIVVVAVSVAGLVGFFIMAALTNSTNSFFIGLVAFGLFFAIVLAAQLVAGYGLVNGALQSSRGETPTLQSMWAMEKFSNYAITSILVGIIVGIGYMLCYIPGIIAAFFLILAPWLAIDQGLAPMDAIKASYERVLAKIGPFFLLWIVTALVAAVGYLLCGIGTFVSVPVALMAFGHGYRQLRLDSPS